MTGLYADLTIEDVLVDPMILALRRADHVDPAAFETLLRARAHLPATQVPTERAGEGAAPPRGERRAMLPAYVWAGHIEASRCSGPRASQAPGCARPW